MSARFRDFEVAKLMSSDCFGYKFRLPFYIRCIRRPMTQLPCRTCLYRTHQLATKIPERIRYRLGLLLCHRTATSGAGG